MTHAWTLGVEEEYFLVDCETLDATPANELVLQQCSLDGVDAAAEMQACTVEIGTPVCASAREVEQALLKARRDLDGRASQFGCRLAAVPTHPFAGLEQTITNGARYQWVSDQYGWVAHRTMTCGMHVHVGIPSMERGVPLLNDLRAYAPLLLALSANSPFVDGVDTGLASVRNRVAGLYPRAGIPPAVSSWPAYQAQQRALGMAGFVSSSKDLWWAVRLHPTWQTVELRVCDVQLAAAHAAAIAALMQALCRMIDHEEGGRTIGRFAEVPDVMFEENLWSAARHGVSGTMIDIDTLTPACDGAEAVPTKVALERLLARLEPWLLDAGNAEALEVARELIGANGACRQRAFHQRSGSLVDLMRRVVEATVEDTSGVAAELPASAEVAAASS